MMGTGGSSSSVLLVLPALQVAVAEMHVGQVCEVFIPAWHAYGAAGAPPDIPPSTDLLFVVELLRIQREEKNKGRSPLSRNPRPEA